MNKLTVTVNKEARQLIMKRDFAAERQLVWDAYTIPELIEAWWGPQNWITKVHHLDLKAGGLWKYCMYEQGGQKMISCGVATYKEIIAPEKMVYTDQFSNEAFEITTKMPTLEITNIFEDHGNTTTLVSITTFSSVEELEKIVEMGVEEGFNQSLIRLDELLQKQVQ
jgi:uncharacterized protein YndB with AHSA1/START domain